MNVQRTTDPSKGKRARKEIITTRMAAALDKCKITERDSTYSLIAYFYRQCHWILMNIS